MKNQEQVTVKGVVASLNKNFSVVSSDGETLAVRRTEGEAVEKALSLGQFEPSVQEQVSSYLIGGTTYSQDGRQIELPEQFKTKKPEGGEYNASLRIPAEHLAGNELSLGDSIELTIEKTLLEVETGNSPIFRATSPDFKMKIRTNEKQTAADIF